AQLRTTQEQLSRDMAKPPEPRVSEARPAVEPRPKQLGAPPRPLGTLVRKPKPVAYPPTQAYVAPPPPPSASPPVQITPSSGQVAIQPDGETVVRPPMPAAAATSLIARRETGLPPQCASGHAEPHLPIPDMKRAPRPTPNCWHNAAAGRNRASGGSVPW